MSLRVRRPTGRKQVQMLVAYGIRREDSRHLLAFLRSQSEAKPTGKGCCRIFITVDWKAERCS